MRLLKILVGLISLNILIISGCGGGGGGGGGDTGKTARLTFSSNSPTPTDQLGGFALIVKLPPGASIKTDAAGVPLPTAVYLSGQFAGSAFILKPAYDNSQKLLSTYYASGSSYALGEFLTVICNVPTSYTPNVNDVVIQTFTAYTPTTGVPMPQVTATFTFI